MTAFVLYAICYFFLKAAFDLLRAVVHQEKKERVGSAIAFVAHVAIGGWALAALLRG